jgi:CxxC motif-containing protein (DUF1111 family)
MHRTEEVQNDVMKTQIRMMARRIGVALCLTGLTTASHAGLIAYEPFAYPTSIPNGTVSTGSGFTGNWTCGTTPSIVTGMTYTDLPVANGALSSTGGRQFVGLAAPLASGTKWISFLFSQAGNNGANHCGIYFPNGGTGLFVGYGLAPVSGSQGGLGLGSLATTGNSPSPAANLASSFLGTYGTTYLIVLKLDFNTSGNNETITVYLNPAANAETPGVAATYTVTTFDVGNITGIGFQNPGGGFAIRADEIRVGDTYGDVVGNGSVPAVPAPIITSVVPGTGVTNGGTVVTISGSNFLAGVTVKFGANTGNAVALVSSNSLIVTTPAGAIGAVNVVVQNTNAMSATNVNGFTYVLPPTPARIVPGSMVTSGSNLNFVWQGATNTISVLLTATNVGVGAIWSPIATNVFGADGLSTNSISINPDEPRRFYGQSVPAALIAVSAPTSLHTIASGSTNAVGLAWNASVTPGVTGYRILYGLNSGALTNLVDVGNVTSAIISGLSPGQTYYFAVIALVGLNQSVATEAMISAQTDTEIGIVALFNTSTPLEPPTTVDTSTALITYVADRARDRHAREDMFNAYDHYLSWYWEQRVANIEIIDRVGKAGQLTNITFNYVTQDSLNPAEFRTFFRGINTVAEYHNNQIATLVSSNASSTPGEIDYHYTATISANSQLNRPLQLGDRVEIEISQFLNAPRHGRANYYGTTVLYIVGQGIVPWAAGKDLGFDGGIVNGSNQSLDSFPLSTNAWLGGLTTLPYQYSNEPEHRFKQTAGNISPTNGLPFMLGRRLHHTDFGTGAHSEPDNPVFAQHVGQLGQKFIARSCVECHVNNGRALPPVVGAPMFQTVVKVGSDANGAPHPTLGAVLQPQSNGGPVEGAATIASYTTNSFQYGDGTPYSLRQPNYAFSGTTPAFFSARLAPPLVGLGLLEAVSESTIAALADPDDANADGISGRMQVVIDPETSQQRLGRFTSKGGKARLSHQIASALNTDMGVTTTVFPTLDGETTNGVPEISAVELDQMMRYVALLGVGARRDLTNAQALQGEQLFVSAQCARCHTPMLTTSAFHPMTELRNQTIRPFTDLLLHDMGPGLADTMGEGVATGSEWRTPPLWNLGLTAGVSGGEAYLHDGRARSLEEAILWHGGEAEAAKEAFRTMSAADRAALLKFLKSL